MADRLYQLFAAGASDAAYERMVRYALVILSEALDRLAYESVAADAARMLDHVREVDQLPRGQIEELRGRALRKLGRNGESREAFETAIARFRSGGRPDEAQRVLTDRLPDAVKTTERELEVLVEVARGASDKEIASILRISPFTVSKHVARILRKVGAASRTEAVYKARRLGLVPDQR